MFISRKWNSPVRADEELDRAGARVAARPRRGHGRGRPCARGAPASTMGEGVSSTTFWWRRCTEHSRSPRCDDVAVLVGQDLDLDVARLLDEALEVDGAVAEGRDRLARTRASTASTTSSGPRTRRMPLPPPPTAALTSSGKPTPSAVATTWRAVVASSSVAPGTTGTPPADTVARALDLVAHRLHRARPAGRRSTRPSVLERLRRTRRSRRGSRSRGGRRRRPTRCAGVEDALDVAGSSRPARAGPRR